MTNIRNTAAVLSEEKERLSGWLYFAIESYDNRSRQVSQSARLGQKVPFGYCLTEGRSIDCVENGLVIITEYNRVGGDTLHRVRVGPFNNVKDADATLTKLVTSGFNTAVIVVEK